MLSTVSPSIYRYKSLGSTNDLMKEMHSEVGLSEGAVVVCENQEKGKGVSGRWESEDGKNLTFSIFLKPQSLNISDQQYLNYIVALSISQFLDQFVSKVQIKWPNDILIDSRKVAGVLIENAFEGKKIKHSIVGIGLNVNQMDFQAFSRKATSIGKELNKEFDLESFLKDFLELFFRNYSRLQYSMEKLKQEYLERLYLKGIKSNFEIDDTKQEGIIVGLDLHGLLQVELESGIRSFDLKEIKFLD
ncbi:biotin--[acetyl-CoA-carboxylase] ligase [Flavobacteriales bacterium]|nr:biotin--[acetyl-CoA-carboxylase] ligase [Flavobacteriales bacterium]